MAQSLVGQTLLWNSLVGHSCGTVLRPLSGTLVEHSLVGHSGGRLWGTLVAQSSVGHCCRKLLRDTPVRHSCGKVLWNTLVSTLVGHSCTAFFFGALFLWDTLLGHSCRTLVWHSLVGWDTLCSEFSCGLSVTLVSHSLVRHSSGQACGALWTLVYRTFVARVKSPNQAFCTRRPPKLLRTVSRISFVRDFPQNLYVSSLSTRLPPKVTRQVSKTSVSVQGSDSFW